MAACCPPPARDTGDPSTTHEACARTDWDWHRAVGIRSQRWGARQCHLPASDSPIYRDLDQMYPESKIPKCIIMACRQRHKHSYVSCPRANEGPRHGPGHDGCLKARSSTTHFPFQISTMASITLSDNVLNATETATVTFTFDADYALLPEKIPVPGGPLPPPVASPPDSPAFGKPHSHPPQQPHSAPTARSP